MQVLKSEMEKFVSEVERDIGVQWIFYNTTGPETSTFVLFTPSLEQHMVEIKLEAEGEDFKWLWKEKASPSYFPCSRELCIHRTKKDIMNSPTYQLLIVRRQLEVMNKNFEKLVELLSNKIEFSPDNPRVMEELSEHFAILAGEQKE